MNITFVLPGFPPRPVGGSAVVYAYGVHLQRRGHQVAIVHPRSIVRSPMPPRRAKETLWPFAMRALKRRRTPWFPTAAGERLLFVSDLRDRFLPPADAIVATSWQTAPPVAAAAAARGQKYYLIQHYETWNGPAEAVDATWRLPLHKIVIARWLWDIGERLGQQDRMTYIPNGLDLDRFRPLTSGEERPPHRVLMLYHPAEWKGTADGLAALARVRSELPTLDAVLFGIEPRPADLPAWIHYVENPHGEELVRLYNSCAVFLHPSRAEGMPAPPAEALACGCALVAAANDGVREYARDEETALLAPIRDPEALAARLLILLRHPAQRAQLARAGMAAIRQRTWAHATDRLEALLLAGREVRPRWPDSETGC